MPVFMLLPLVLLIVAALAVGVAPQARDVAAEAADRFTDTAGYRAAVLQGMPQRNRHSRAVAHQDGHGYRRCPVGADPRCSRALQFLPAGAGAESAERLISPVIRFFRGLHSGYIGDYVTWFIIGAALLVLAGTASEKTGMKAVTIKATSYGYGGKGIRDYLDLKA